MTQEQQGPDDATEAGASTPFAGSGTTLVEANALGIHALGVELSAFNCRIIEAKTRRCGLPALRRDVDEALHRLEAFSSRLTGEHDLPLSGGAAAAEIGDCRHF